VIDVGVREQDEVDVTDLEVQSLAILAVGIAPALEHAAIHKERAR
jgi:hypothetical protein